MELRKETSAAKIFTNFPTHPLLFSSNNEFRENECAFVYSIHKNVVYDLSVVSANSGLKHNGAIAFDREVNKVGSTFERGPRSPLTWRSLLFYLIGLARIPGRLFAYHCRFVPLTRRNPDREQERAELAYNLPPPQPPPPLFLSYLTGLTTERSLQRMT